MRIYRQYGQSKNVTAGEGLTPSAAAATAPSRREPENKPPSLREGDREAVEGAVELPQSLRDSPLREGAKEKPPSLREVARRVSRKRRDGRSNYDKL